MEPMNDVTAHLTTGAIVVYGLEWLKRAGWCRVMTADTGALNRLVSALAAALMAFGISATGDVATGWTIHVPSLAVLVAGVWEFSKQFVVQQILYQSVIAPRVVKMSSGPRDAAHDGTDVGL